MAERQERAGGRVERRKQRNREALIQAGYAVMSARGIDAATMLEIAERADVGAGTVYTYFKSKDELAIAVLETVMNGLALRIEDATRTFDDPARVFAYGVRQVMQKATTDISWRQLLARSEVLSDALIAQFGPFAKRDLERARASGRFQFEDVDLLWRMVGHAIVGFARAVVLGHAGQTILGETAGDTVGETAGGELGGELGGEVGGSVADKNGETLGEAVVTVLCMVGLARDEAYAVAAGPWPPLPPQSAAEGAVAEAT
ncbi:MAG: TetR/AcrR family transcriptional regulator [Pseudomonadota bacterium]